VTLGRGPCSRAGGQPTAGRRRGLGGAALASPSASPSSSPPGSRLSATAAVALALASAAAMAMAAAPCRAFAFEAATAPSSRAAAAATSLLSRRFPPPLLAASPPLAPNLSGIAATAPSYSCRFRHQQRAQQVGGPAPLPASFGRDQDLDARFGSLSISGVSWGKEDDEDDSDGEGEEDSETAGAGGKRKRVAAAAAAAAARPRWGDELAPLMIPGPLNSKHR
jgi:hypothetical protein